MNKDFTLADVRCIRKVTVGSTNPNMQTSDEEREKQLAVLNHYLNDFPRGRIIGKDINFGVYAVGEHQVVMQSTTYHVGFHRMVDEEPGS